MTTFQANQTNASASPNRSTSDSTSPATPVGLDVGNAGVKIFSGMAETLAESYVYYPSDRFSNSTAGYVEYLSGSRTDLIGKHWIGGIGAYYACPTGITRTIDDRSGKVDQCLQLFLAGLSQLPHRPEWKLNIAASVHDGKVLGSALRKALAGRHVVKLRGKESTVEITVVGVLEEGSGVAIALHQTHDFNNAVLLDMGGGTAIFSSFVGVQLTQREYSTHSGAEALINAIANSEHVRRYLLRPGDRHLIRAGIEKGDFSYGSEKGWNFKDAYAAEFPGWFRQGLVPFVKSLENKFYSASARLACGGGSLLPGIGAALDQKGITVVDNPRWANAKGLYQLALRAGK